MRNEERHKFVAIFSSLTKINKNKGGEREEFLLCRERERRRRRRRRSEWENYYENEINVQGRAGPRAERIEARLPLMKLFLCHCL
jgi:hypothetical protein